MTTPATPRILGTYGRRPAKRAPAIRFSAIRQGAPVTAPPAVDYLAAMGGGWLMLGNGPDDSVAPGFPGCGDCVAVTWANIRRVISTVLGTSAAAAHMLQAASPVPAFYPPWSQVLAVYQTQNPQFDPAGDPSVNGPGSDADGGMDIQTLLEYLVRNPGPDGSKLVGFAAVDYTSAEEVRAAIAAGGVLWLGISVQAAQENQFAAGQPWDYAAGSPVEGGHSVVCGGYGTEVAGGTPAMAADEKFVTWAAETSFTDAFWQNEVEELWFPVWEEQLGTAEFQSGVDLAAFAAEYQAITGKPFPVTVPPVPVPPGPAPAPVPPSPAPVPVPSVDAADVTLAQAVGDWPEHHHIGENERVARALETWLAAKNLI